MEQVAEAALDVRALELAFSIVNEIRQQFPEAQRALRITVKSEPTQDPMLWLLLKPMLGFDLFSSV